MSGQVIKPVLDAKETEEVLERCGMGISQQEKPAGFKDSITLFQKGHGIGEMFNHIEAAHHIEVAFRKTSFLQRPKMEGETQDIFCIINGFSRHLHTHDLPSPPSHLREKEPKTGS